MSCTREDFTESAMTLRTRLSSSCSHLFSVLADQEEAKHIDHLDSQDEVIADLEAGLAHHRTLGIGHLRNACSEGRSIPWLQWSSKSVKVAVLSH